MAGSRRGLRVGSSGGPGANPEGGPGAGPGAKIDLNMRGGIWEGPAIGAEGMVYILYLVRKSDLRERS